MFNINDLTENTPKFSEQQEMGNFLSSQPQMDSGKSPISICFDFDDNFNMEHYSCLDQAMVLKNEFDYPTFNFKRDPTFEEDNCRSFDSPEFKRECEPLLFKSWSEPTKPKMSKLFPAETSGESLSKISEAKLSCEESLLQIDFGLSNEEVETACNSIVSVKPVFTCSKALMVPKITNASQIKKPTLEKVNLKLALKKNVKKQTDKDTSVSCPHCDKVFSSSTSLGGHVSKSHPGQSKAYNKKQMVRDNNEFDREMRKKAKQYLIKETSRDPRTCRAKVTEIKKLFMAFATEPTEEDQQNLQVALHKIVSKLL